MRVEVRDDWIGSKMASNSTDVSKVKHDPVYCMVLSVSYNKRIVLLTFRCRAPACH